jgi:perosamine synthetase
MRNGESVAAFEKAFAEYVGAKYAIALCNGTATLHTALAALGVKPGDRVAVPPLTMSATTIAVLQAGAVPVFVDVEPDTWVMDAIAAAHAGYQIPVSLYGLNYPYACRTPLQNPVTIDDAAQTLRKADPRHAFTSYSFQASKILALGEGGMLCTNDEKLATRARSFSSLGYKLDPKSPRIDPSILKDPSYERHHLGASWNYRLNDITAKEGLFWLGRSVDGRYLVEQLKDRRVECAYLYWQAIKGCDWITPQFVPDGWTHDYWCYAFAVSKKELWHPLVDAIVKFGGERPYGAWRLTYQEPAFSYLATNHSLCQTCGNNGQVSDSRGRWWCSSEICRAPSKKWPLPLCPVAEDLQPRLVQMQCNNLESAERNAKALKLAIQYVERTQKLSSMFEGTIGIPCE